MLDDQIMKGTFAEKIVPIIDNDPCHFGLEILESEPQYAGLSILRPGSYSAPLNPIEAIWNSVKAVLKAKHADGLKRMLDDVGRGDLTLVEFRLRYLENLMAQSLDHTIPESCRNCINHVQMLVGKVIQFQYLPFGL